MTPSGLAVTCGTDVLDMSAPLSGVNMQVVEQLACSNEGFWTASGTSNGCLDLNQNHSFSCLRNLQNGARLAHRLSRER